MAGHALPKQPDDHGALAASDDLLSRYAAFVTQDDKGLSHITFAVDGVHCAGCIQKIESALHADPAVQQARLNFSTGRLSVSWQDNDAYADRLADKVTALGYGVQAYDPRDSQHGSDKENRFLLLCLGVAGFAAGNIMLLSFGLWSTTGEVMGVAMRDFLHWIAALIAIPAVGFAGQPFFRSAFRALRSGHTNMDVPISLALILTVGMSVFEAFNHGEHVYFDSAVMLMFFLLIGRYLDFRARESARGSATGLLSMMAGTATVLEGGQRRILPIRDLSEGMSIIVGMGERIPADGKIMSGRSEIDASLVTGESLPQEVREGDDVYAGTMNMAAVLTIRVQKAAEDSLLADIVRLMEKAEQGQARYVRLADRAAKLYTPVVHTLAAVTFLGWFFLGDLVWQPSLLIAVTVLIITCPCALGLAVPVVQVLAIGKLMKNKILVKSGDALERLAAIDTVLMDKTGTLTLGKPTLDNIEGYKESDLRLAVSLAVHSRHPLAQALASAYDDPVNQVQVKELPGQGLEAMVSGKKARLGSRSWCGDEQTAPRAEKLELWLNIEGREPMPFYFSDPLRPDAQDVTDTFKALGHTIYLVSGDRPEAVEHTARKLGIENWQGGMKPGDKFALLEKLNAQGHKTLMTGDGLNDAPVLAGAHASISPSSAIDLAQNAADIVFMGDKLAPVITACETAKLSQKLVKQNFTLAVLYNVIAVPLAVLGYVTPMIAALAMSGSSLIVIANSFRLRWSKT